MTEPHEEQTDEHLAAASQSARKASVYADAVSTPAMGATEETESPALPDLPAEAKEERPASPTDNLTLPVHVNGADGIARSNSEDPTSVLIATLRLQNGDLHSQVDMLNSKLVSSYGRYGDIEEELERTQRQMGRMKQQNDSLLKERQRWEARVEGGMLVEKAHVQDELTRMMDRVLEETAQRGKAETDKETIEKELDDLSASLFGEANRMVAIEKEARAIAEQKTRSLEDRLRDTEGMISHQADQMKQLGGVIETIERERDEIKGKLTSIEADPAFIAARDALPRPTEEEIAASQPSSPRIGGFPGLLARLPELLTDILPHHEFHIFVRHLHRLRITTLSRPHEPSTGSMQIALGGSMPSSPDPQTRLNDLLPLSQHLSQPFIKRCQEEDSDPTIRLDLAPGLTWLNRRSVGQAIIDGQLVIEPAYQALRPTEKCALCGASLEQWLVDPNAAPSPPAATGGQAAMRKLMGTQAWSSQGWAKWAPKSLASTPPAAVPPAHNSPIHVFRTSDATSTSSQHALCPNYCLPRLRAVCDLWTAIRNIERSLLLGDRAPTQGIGSSLRDGGSRRSLGIGTVSNLLRRTPSSEPKSPSLSADVSTLPTPVEERPPAVAESPEPVVEPATVEVEPATDAEKVDEAPVINEPSASSEQTESVETEKKDEESSPEQEYKEAKEEQPALTPPPLPKRSIARSTSPAPVAALAPAAPIRRAVSAKVEPAIKVESAWEEKAWQDLVKLKEALFWARIGVVSPEKTVLA